MLMMNSSAGRMFLDARFLANDAFTPLRSNQKAIWYMNGAKYMEHILWALNNAREEIFISLWWLTPEIFLIRPTADLQYRLDQVLLKKADQGVKIYILIFKEV